MYSQSMYINIPVCGYVCVCICVYIYIYDKGEVVEKETIISKQKIKQKC